ncbi:hypothetical protein [uncultured Sphingomonas sp.]|uniref:hypothetical protein n=1 Tax=uncultured Sphingomonas sp. TaxID=158754 RepID=UPI0035CBD4BB
MTDCDDLIERFHVQAQTHVALAVIAETTPVVEMHIDLALFSEERARAFKELCDDG